MKIGIIKKMVLSKSTASFRRNALAVCISIVLLWSLTTSRSSASANTNASAGSAARRQETRPRQVGASANRPASSGQEDESKNKKSAADAASIFIASQDDYYIGPTDIVEIKIEDAPELSQTYQVNASGYIEMQVIGKILTMGKTPDQLAAAIKAALIKEDYLKFPNVNVNVKEYNSRTFYIQGSVRTPGAYKIRGKVNILQLITLAGGLIEGHGPLAYIIRQKKSGGGLSPNASNATPDASGGAGAQSPAIAAKPLLTAGNESLTGSEDLELVTTNINGFERGIFDGNIAIEPGDIINIPALNVFFIGGEVRAPGSYPLKEGTSLKHALALAQGTTFSAAKTKTVIFRGDIKDGKQLEIPVDLDGVMSGKKPDILLQANDFIVVPNSKMKSITGTVLQAFGMQSIQRGVLIR
jgi:polysaccharide biosynthesis/export protein